MTTEFEYRIKVTQNDGPTLWVISSPEPHGIGVDVAVLRESPEGALVIHSYDDGARLVRRLERMYDNHKMRRDVFLQARSVQVVHGLWADMSELHP